MGGALVSETGSNTNTSLRLLDWSGWSCGSCCYRVWNSESWTIDVAFVLVITWITAVPCKIRIVQAVFRLLKSRMYYCSPDSQVWFFFFPCVCMASSQWECLKHYWRGIFFWKNFNSFSSGTSALPLTFIDTVAVLDDRKKLLPGVSDYSSFAIFMEKIHEVPMEVPIFTSKMVFVVYQCFLSAGYFANSLVLLGKQLVVQGEIYLWDSAVTLPVDCVQCRIGKRLFIDGLLFSPKQEKLEVSRYSACF